jgi:class 3 adenylate cyclase/tetratricopeptide (TPR) repeat protein
VSAKFCPECGAQIGATTDTARERDPRVYTPKHLAEKILRSKSALEGERKQVTVLFADVKGSMELAEQLDPEEWHHIMDRFFQILTEGVHRLEGTVNQYTGDGIMALFGAPIAHEDHAQRACWAALQLRDALRRYADTLRVERGLSFSTRLGLNSGEVVVGGIGDDLRMDYTAQGHTVGLAQRMEQLAEPGTICLTEHTARLVAGYFQLRDLGPLAVKGVREPLRVHVLESAGALRTRLDVSRARGFSRFVARQDEMAMLETALARALDGHGQVVGIVAEPGVGKSRLCFEFAERCRARGLRVREAHAVAHGKGVPFLTLLEYLRADYGITEEDSPLAAREKITGRLLLLDPELAEALPLFFDLLGVSDPERPAPRMDPEARQRQLFAATRRVIHAQSRREPLVAVIEDLHWTDASSEAFLANWVEVLGATRSLLLVNFRPEYHAAWMQKSYYQQLPLLPLGPEASEELLRDLLGTDPSLAGLAERIKRRTGGNPFFVEEMVQGLVEAGHLAGAKGAYRVATPLVEEALPASVQAVLAARIDRLGEREKGVLQTAAVIGKEFAEPILARVADVPAGDLAPALDALTSAELLYETALYPEAEYAFKHPLTQEVAYRSQLGERRARGHRAVARTLLDLYADKLDEKAAVLAYHWEAAGEKLEAARWYARAGRWLGMRDASAAYDHWGRVRRLAAGSDDDERTELVARACGQLLNLGIRVGGVGEDEIAALFAEGTMLAERRGDLRGMALLHLYCAAARGSAFGDEEARAALGRRATEIAERTGDVAVERAALLPWAWGSILLGRLLEGLAVSERALRLPPTGTAHWGLDDHAFARVCRSIAFAQMGQLDESRREAELGAARARECDDPENLTFIHDQLVSIFWLAGDADAALSHALRAQEYQERRGSPMTVGTAQNALGFAHVLCGRWSDAIQAFEETVAARRRTGVDFVPQALSGLAEALLGAGELARARAAADEAVALAERFHMRPTECQARIIRARVQLHDGPAARTDVEADLARVTTLVEETGARVWMPFIHVERAALAQLMGDETARQRELREAHRLFTEMGATGHAVRVAKELGSS